MSHMTLANSMGLVPCFLSLLCSLIDEQALKRSSFDPVALRAALVLLSALPEACCTTHHQSRIAGSARERGYRTRFITANMPTARSKALAARAGRSFIDPVKQTLPSERAKAQEEGLVTVWREESEYGEGMAGQPRTLVVLQHVPSALAWRGAGCNAVVHHPICAPSA